MLSKLRQRAADESGFTLIELLVVILIIGVLAAIAIPSFLNQRNKANDANAKALARTAQTAEESYYTDNQTYVAQTQGAGTSGPLDVIEATLAQAQGPGSGTTANGLVAQTCATTTCTIYSVAVQSKAGIWYEVVRNSSGNIIHSCGTAAYTPTTAQAGAAFYGTGNPGGTAGNSSGGCNASNSW